MLSELVQPLTNQCRCMVALVCLECSAIAQPVVNSPAYLVGVAAVGRRIALKPLGTKEAIYLKNMCDVRPQPRRVFIS